MPIQKETACKGTALKNIKYIINPEKTVDENGEQWVATHNMIASGHEAGKDLHKEFREVNLQYGKNKSFDERKYYHVVINGKGTGMTREQLLETGYAYLNRYYPNHQAVLAVHEDHVHCCVNSIDFVTGKKVNRTDKELAERKDFVNEYCFEKYGIEPFDWQAAAKIKREKEKNVEPTGNKENYSYIEQQMHQNGRTSELDVLRERILRTALVSKSREEFKEKLQNDYGIEMPRNTEKTVSFKYKEEKKGTVRGHMLGDYYSAEFIDKMIQYNQQSKDEHNNFEPALNFEAFEKIAKERDYKLAQKYDLTMPQETFERMSEPELTSRVAFSFVKNQEKGIAYNKDGELYIAGVKVQKAERMQKMYDAAKAAESCRKKYGCKTEKELQSKEAELQEKLKDVKAELRKERKIETALKNKHERKLALHEALKIVYQEKGSPEEQNKAKHVLYRNGLSKEDFRDVKTINKISGEVIDSKNRMMEQEKKVKELYHGQKDIQRDIEELNKALAGNSLAQNIQFYYTNDELEYHLNRKKEKTKMIESEASVEEFYRWYKIERDMKNDLEAYNAVKNNDFAREKLFAKFEQKYHSRIDEAFPKKLSAKINEIHHRAEFVAKSAGATYAAFAKLSDTDEPRKNNNEYQL